MERMSEADLKRHVEESKYRITLKEWNYLKKRIKYVIGQHPHPQALDLDVGFHKDGSRCNVCLLVTPDFVDLVQSFFRRVSHNSYLIYSDEVHELNEAINKELNHHDICYSERDSMSDYNGLYRFNAYCSIDKKEGQRQIFSQLDAMIEDLARTKRDSSIGLNDFLNVCEKHELSKEFITQLYNKNK